MRTTWRQWLAVGVERVASQLSSHPRRVAASLLVLLGASAATLPWMRVESGTSIFIPDGDPARRIQQLVERQFIGEDLLFLGFDQADPFSADALLAQRQLDGRLQTMTTPLPDGGTLALVDDVVSLTTVKTVDGADQFYRTVPVVPDDVPTDAGELARLEARARANPLIRDGLLSSDRRASAALVRLTRGLTDEQFADVTRQVRALLHEGEVVAGRRGSLAGDPVVTVDTAVYQEEDLIRFIPVCYALLTVAMVLYLRRLRGVLLAVVNATVALLVGMAMVALFASLTNLTTIMPPLLMVLSVATVVHFTSEYALHSKRHPPREALRATFAELLVPTFMCEATTAVGFSSFAASAIPALREFGVAAALAVMGAMVASFLLLALVGSFVPAERLISSAPGPLTDVVTRLVGAVTELALRRPRTLLGATLLVSALLAVGLTRLRVNHDDIDQFDEATPLQQATRFFQQHLGGAGELVVSVKASPGRFLEPAELQKVEQLQTFLVNDFGASSTASVADLVKLMNRGFNGDSPEAWRLPSTREQVAQLVFLNGDDRLFHSVDRDFGWIRVEARTKETGSDELTRRFARLEDYLAKAFPTSRGYEARASGSTYLSVVLGNRILESQTTSFGLSLLLIFLPIALMFGSLSAGAFTVPSNLFPILACLGFMGWAGLALDISTTMIASIVLGIAVDDTIHFVQNIRRLLGEGRSHEDAVRETLVTKGASAVWITFIIGMGFVSLVASRFKPTVSFGLLTAFGMGSGVVAELFLLPPLLVLTRSRLGVPERVDVPDASAAQVPIPDVAAEGDR